MKVYFTRDYRNINTKQYGFNSGIFHNIGVECEDFRYFDIQIRGIGQLSFYWQRN